MPSYTLYSYFRSSASWRVRIGLALKGLPYRYRPVHLLRDGGEQFSDAYRALNPMSELPCLVVHGDADPEGPPEAVLAQSIAILEYLDEVHPSPPLLPSSAADRARVRQLVESVNSSIQPLQNLKVLKHLHAAFGADKDATQAWGRHWIAQGFGGLEALLARTAGRHAFGDSVTLADVVLVPQVFNARRFGVELAPFPTIQRVEAAAMALPAFQAATPDHQPDHEG